MGLDQYVYFAKKAAECNCKGDCMYKREYLDLGRPAMEFRKNRHLQGYMERLWRERGNEGEFNCEDIELTEDDLKNLTKDSLKSDKGFFWGDHDLEYDWKEIKHFKRKALEALKKGYVVVYDSWW